VTASFSPSAAKWPIVCMLSELFEVGTDFSIMLVLCCSKQSACPQGRYTFAAIRKMQICGWTPAWEFHFYFQRQMEHFALLSTLSNQIKYGINLKHNTKRLLELFVSCYYTFNMLLPSKRLDSKKEFKYLCK
jgi:hypothetical protein